MRIFLWLLSTTIFAACAVTGRADTYQFTFAGSPADGVQSFRFTLPSSPIPNQVDTDLSFLVFPSDLTVDGVSNPDYLGAEFPTNPGDLFGGVIIGNRITPLEWFGPQLFTGTTANPTFKLGTFDLTSFIPPEGFVVPPQYLFPLETTDLTPPSAVPEPSTIMLLGTGVLGLAAARRGLFRR